MATFADRLKEVRNTRGYTQKAMAERLGIQETSYQHYEYGKREPNHEITIKLADILEVSTDYLLGRVNADGNIKTKAPPNIFTDEEKESLR